MKIKFNVIKKPEGFCPKCGMAYGVMIRSDTGQVMNEFVDCMCDEGIIPPSSYEKYWNINKNFTNRKEHVL